MSKKINQTFAPNGHSTNLANQMLVQILALSFSFTPTPPAKSGAAAVHSRRSAFSLGTSLGLAPLLFSSRALAACVIEPECSSPNLGAPRWSKAGQQAARALADVRLKEESIAKAAADKKAAEEEAARQKAAAEAAAAAAEKTKKEEEQAAAAAAKAKAKEAKAAPPKAAAPKAAKPAPSKPAAKAAPAPKGGGGECTKLITGREVCK